MGTLDLNRPTDMCKFKSSLKDKSRPVGRLLESFHFQIKHSTLRLHFQKLEVKETVIGQCALDYLNNHSLHAGYINHVLHKTTIANTLNHVETRTSVQNTSKIQVGGNLFRGFT